MSDSRNLCRGWTAQDIRAAIADASEKQRAVLVQIAENPMTTTEEIADELGWASHLNVRAVLSQFSQTTGRLHVIDPRTGKESWPFEIHEPAPGTAFWRYFMPPAAAAVVREVLGSS
jgi:hypothetical protein